MLYFSTFNAEGARIPGSFGEAPGGAPKSAVTADKAAIRLADSNKIRQHPPSARPVRKYQFMKRLCLSVLALTALTACSTQPDAILRADADAVNVQVMRGAPELAGYRAVGVSVRRNGSGVSAPCTLSNSQIRAEFTAPTEVNIPSFGPNSEAVDLNCTVDGQAYQQRFLPENLSQSRRRQNGLTAGILLGGVIGGAIGGSVVQEQEDDAIGFRDMVLRID